MKITKTNLICLLLLLTSSAVAQMSALERIEPANWWVGMKNTKLQLIVHGNQIASRNVRITYPGVTLLKTNKVENPNYLFLDVEISPATQPGIFPIRFEKKGDKAIVSNYELKARNVKQVKAQGVTTKDLMYLIMPDRFANGDKTNDIVKGMTETTLNRDSMYHRHGGDIQGIINNLDYLRDLGVTALWINPLLTNDQPKTSYHGYANTENYRIDPRYGTNELYKKLIDEMHKRGMKMVKDLVHNHLGSRHWTVLDLPSKDWLNQWPTFTRTTYREQTHFDPYASAADKKQMVKGWFDFHMPDPNQQNPYVRNYITQSHIWWVEYAGVDAFRLDTYAYNDLDYMAEWAKAIKAEYPNLNSFGETWVQGVPSQTYFTEGNVVNQGFDSGLDGVTDFQALWGINEALNGKFGWTDGVVRLYNTLAYDYQYKDATKNVVFLDNHDLNRFYSVVNEDFSKYKSGIAWVLTTRGIPQFYYGNEILMTGTTTPDGKVRLDFKGGWPEDKVNKFTAAGRTEKENEAFNYVRKLANYRKNNEVLQTGKMMQFVPQDGVYVYFRYNADNTVMMLMNGEEKEVTVSTARFAERTSGFTQAVNVATDEVLADLSQIKIPAKTTLVLELKK
ncbi:MAG: glycoside hydrolase family 13 protein [Sphingobacteriales bacterium]|nr:glycoside hydrolase family 13 protein [Sphingobacteriales bacterium]